jgi:hypothetical protein
MVNEWSLREEAFAVAHKWPIPVLAFIIGSLVGLGVALLYPSPHRASTDISVAYNADAIYTNPDDYKNWQLSQLNALATAPDVLQETLNRLRASDPTWAGVSSEELQKSLILTWRTTGLWHLAAENVQPEKAIQVVQTWSDVLLEKYQQAFDAATQMSDFDRQLFSMDQTLTQAKWRYAQLTSVKAALQAWRSSASQGQVGQPPDSLARWRIFSLVEQAGRSDAAWKTLLDEMPSAQAPAQTYFPWVDQVITVIDSQAQTLQSQIDSLKPEQTSLSNQQAAAALASRGLSGNLAVKKATNATPEVTSLRPTSLMALVGGILGFLIWLIVWLARIPFRSKK